MSFGSNSARLEPIQSSPGSPDTFETASPASEFHWSLCNGRGCRRRKTAAPEPIHRHRRRWQGSPRQPTSTATFGSRPGYTSRPRRSQCSRHRRHYRTLPLPSIQVSERFAYVRVPMFYVPLQTLTDDVAQTFWNGGVNSGRRNRAFLAAFEQARQGRVRLVRHFSSQ